MPTGCLACFCLPVAKLEELHDQQQHQVLPCLLEMLEELQQVQMFAQKRVDIEVDHHWQQPAQHLLPGHTCKRYADGPHEQLPLLL